MLFNQHQYRFLNSKPSWKTPLTKFPFCTKHRSTVSAELAAAAAMYYSNP